MALVSLSARTKTLGEYDENTLSSQAMLALAKKSWGRWDGAEKLEAQVMETSKKVLGAEHPSMLTSMENLAHTLKAQGNNRSASALMEDCASMSLRRLESDHPHTVDRVEIAKDWKGVDC
jgi:hypothetical protein